MISIQNGLSFDTDTKKFSVQSESGKSIEQEYTFDFQLTPDGKDLAYNPTQFATAETARTMVGLSSGVFSPWVPDQDPIETPHSGDLVIRTIGFSNGDERRELNAGMFAVTIIRHGYGVAVKMLKDELNLPAPAE